MSITDELREWMRVVLTDDDPAYAIADRIDEKHERTFRNLTDALHKQEDATRELAEKSVLLPVDADGEVIHIGDVMWQKDRITKRACKAIMGDAYVMLDGVQGAVYAKGLTHYHAPTVEDVLREFGDWYAHTKGGCDEDGIIVEYAAKLRLRGDA